MASGDTILERKRHVGRRTLILGAIVALGFISAAYLRLNPAELVPNRGGLALAAEFFSAAFRPTLTSEGETTVSLLPNIWTGVRMTVIFAASGMSVAVVLGIVLGFFGSTAWWSNQEGNSGSFRTRLIRYGIYGPTRVIIAWMRSIHELIWALLFLAAFGLNHVAAVVAIAIPFGGTLAKIFSEMIDEAPRDAGDTFALAGATGTQTFTFGLLPRALPDMAAYTFYRFECALRSSAVLGFFGFPTLGYYLSGSFENLYYREAWTYLYSLFVLVVLVEFWSTRLRQHWVAR